MSVAPHQIQMDRIYKLQRHFYDLTRKYYLFGRDRLLKQLASVTAPSGAPRILEMGCGTGRNLIRLARMIPAADLYGIDASPAMLDVAKKKIDRAGFSDRIRLAAVLAENTSPATFALPQPFDSVFFSYSLSMIPTWQSALQAAMDSMRTGGELYVVDFWDATGLPEPARKLLFAWLRLFHVHYRPELIDYLHTMCANSTCQLNIQPVGPRYAFTASLKKN